MYGDLVRYLKVLRSHATPLASGAGPLAASPPRRRPAPHQRAGTGTGNADEHGRCCGPEAADSSLTPTRYDCQPPARRSRPPPWAPECSQGVPLLGFGLVRRAPRGVHRRAPRICHLMTKYSRAHLPTYPAIAVTFAILFCGSPIEAAVLRARPGTASAPRRTPRSESSACEMFEPHHRGSPRR